MSWGEVQKLQLEGGTLPPGGAVDEQGKPAVQATDASFLLPAGTIGNALGILIELLSANLGAGDPRLRSEPPEKVPEGEPTTCVFVFFALNLAMFDGLDFPAVRLPTSQKTCRRNQNSPEALVLSAQGRSRKDNVSRMVEAIFQGNGTARIVGQRKYAAKQRSEEHGGSLLFAPESKEAFEEVTPGIVCTNL